MPAIHRLPPDVIHAIAAGEVIERPAGVVKELIENAFDAGATKISVEIEESGLRRITITDNGNGMSREDLALATERYTTSKIFSAKDLDDVETFGFRGEALASIAHASELMIKTRARKEKHGSVLDAKSEITPIGMPFGTVVEVRALLSHIPVRKKFLKTPATELRHIIEVVNALALSKPELSFTLENNGKLLFTLPKQTLLERITELVAPASLWLPITGSDLRGYIGMPQLASRSNSKQFLFVNGRFVTHPTLARLIKSAYRTQIDPRSEPAFVLSLHIAPSMIDVNIHPRKETIRFSDETELFERIRHSLEETLHNADLTFHYDPSPPPQNTLREYTPQLLSDVEPWKFDSLNEDPQILQIDRTYLCTKTADGIILVDQHAAHERILYEQFVHAATQKTTAVELSSAVTVTLSPIEFQMFTTHQPLLTQFGFECEVFGHNAIKISRVPELLQDRNLTKLIKDILAELEENSQLDLTALTHRTLAFLSCRSAVKAGDFLTPDQRRELLTKLTTTPHHFTCPHGRPTIIRIDVPELERLFRRRT